jgi:ATP synthase protein I
MVRPLLYQAVSWDGSLSPSEPDDLKRLGERVEAARRKSAGPERQATPNSPYSIAFRLGTEMVSAVIVGAGIGWGIDWAFQHWAHVMTRPVGMVVMFFLGALAGIRNVYRTSQQINADTASKEK